MEPRYCGMYPYKKEAGEDFTPKGEAERGGNGQIEDGSRDGNDAVTSQ